MSYYDTFLSVTKSPKEFYLNQMQQLVEESFDNSSTVQFDVEEEIDFGSLNFKICEARITSLIDVKTGKKINDDFKKIIFKDITHQPKLGTRYRFENSIWLIFSTNNIKSATSSAYIQRCNNTLNTQDNYGNVHQEPCCVDFNLMETKLFMNNVIDVPAGRIEVKCQLNKYTKNINIDDRFIFGEDAYKLRTRVKFNRTYTFEQDSTNILSFYADYNGISEYDNKELMVANYKVYNYSIICQDNIKNIIGYTDILNAKVYLDGKEINEPVLWYSSNSDITSINETTGEYVLKALGSCQIICKLKNNINYITNIDVDVVDIINDNYQSLITPNVTYLKLNQIQSYDVYEYNNGIKTGTTFTINAYDAPLKNYKLVYSQNGFSVTNLKYTENTLLKIICHNDKTSEDSVILIELGGMF